jgi:hypothetical protein
VAKTLSTTTFAPIRLATATTGDVDDFKRRIGRAFEEQHLGVGPDRSFPGQVRPSTSVVSMPYCGSSVSTIQRHEPNSARAETT